MGNRHPCFVRKLIMIIDGVYTTNVLAAIFSIEMLLMRSSMISFWRDVKLY